MGSTIPDVNCWGGSRVVGGGKGWYGYLALVFHWGKMNIKREHERSSGMHVLYEKYVKRE
jgi:hypothetical protein